jgi:hypothetical protein
MEGGRDFARPLLLLGVLLAPAAADMAPADALGPCCLPHNTGGCDDHACQEFVCKGQGGRHGDPYCCAEWWTPYCANAAAGVGPMSERDPFHGDKDTTQNCAVCRGPSPSPPPELVPPPEPPNRPPFPFSDAVYGATICIAFDSNISRGMAIENQLLFRSSVAAALNLWPERVTLPLLEENGCACGTDCSYNGCFNRGVSVAGQSMLYVAPAVRLHILSAQCQSERLLWPGDSIHDLCNRVQDPELYIEVDVCFGCVGMGQRILQAFRASTGLAGVVRSRHSNGGPCHSRVAPLLEPQTLGIALVRSTPTCASPIGTRSAASTSNRGASSS